MCPVPCYSGAVYVSRWHTYMWAQRIARNIVNSKLARPRSPVAVCHAPQGPLGPGACVTFNLFFIRRFVHIRLRKCCFAGFISLGRATAGHLGAHVPINSHVFVPFTVYRADLVSIFNSGRHKLKFFIFTSASKRKRLTLFSARQTNSLFKRIDFGLPFTVKRCRKNCVRITFN